MLKVCYNYNKIQYLQIEWNYDNKRNKLTNRINSTLKTLYNWETSKPELIKLLLLGLQKEKKLTKRMDIIEKVRLWFQ